MSAPYMKRVHVAQGFPKSSTDAAPTAVFLVLFFIGALSNAFIFLRNKKRGHKFLFNGLCIGFCMARVITCSIRLAWMYDIEDRSVGIAAVIFVAAGVLILFLINLIFAQRLLRGLHPHLGWSKALSKCFLVLYILIPLLLVMVIFATIHSFYSTNKRLAMDDLDMQRAASTYFMVVAFLPIPIVLFAVLYPKKNDPDHFGKGTLYTKAAFLLATSLLLTIGATFRTGTSFVSWKTEYNTNPPWFNAKWCFYFFNFTLEFLVIVLYVGLRIDLMFHIPNGSSGPYSYTQARNADGEKQVLEVVETRGLQRRSTDQLSHGLESPQSSHISPVVTKSEV